MRTQDPGVLIYRKYALSYVRELMGEVLDSVEEAAVLLHCGILSGDPVAFSEIAELLKLSSAERAGEIYDQAIRKTRKAIPGSRLEHWLVCYRVTCDPRREERIRIDPDLPVPRWV